MYRAPAFDLLGDLFLPRSIRLRSPAAPKTGAEEKGRVTPLRMTAVRGPCRIASGARYIVHLRQVFVLRWDGIP
jgi:hypothetical protein